MCRHFFPLSLASRPKAALLTVIWALACSGLLHAEGQWVSKGPWGGGIYVLAIDPQLPSTIYATGPGGVFRSRNSGDTWTPINEGLPTLMVYALVVDPQSPTTLYVSTEPGFMYRSSDSGDSWVRADSGLPYTPVGFNALVIDPSEPSILYAGTEGEGIYRTRDAGETWEAVSVGLPENAFVDALAIDPANPSILYAGTSYDGVFRSTDSGDTWEAINNGLGSLRSARVLAIDPITPSTVYVGGPGGVFRSKDSGDSWTAINNGLSNDPFIYALAIDPIDPATLYAMADGVFRSTDSGESWTLVSTGQIDDTGMALAIDPLEPSILYSGTFYSGVFRSRDSGTTWEAVNTGLLSQAIGTLVVDPTSPQGIYAGGGGVFRSEDSGQTWTAIHNGPSSRAVETIAIDPLTPSTLYVGTRRDGPFRSMDYGENWVSINNDLNFWVSTLAVDPVTPTNLYLGSDPPTGAPVQYKGLYRSWDAGDTWERVSGYMGEVDVMTIAIDSKNPATVYAGHGASDYPPVSRGISRSNDFGDTWMPTPGAQDYREVKAVVIDPVTPSTIYAGGSALYSEGLWGGVSCSRDSGDSWETLTGDLSVLALAIDPKNPSTLYAGTSGAGVLRSTDSGETWEPMNSGLNNLYVHALAIAPTTPSTLFAGTWGQGVFLWVPELSITGLSPIIASSGITITLVGTGFLGGDVGVFFNGVSGQNIEVVNGETVRVTLPELPPGPVEVEVTTEMGSVTLPAGPDGLTITDITESSFYFPQYAAGVVGNLQFQSKLLLANTGADSWVRVDFFRSPDGEPMLVTLDELGTDSSFEFALRERESVSLSTPGTGELQVGYARVTAGETVGGVVIFQRTDLPTGISLYEAGVPASQQLTEFSLFVDSLGVRDTGVAIVYPSQEGEGASAQSADANITVRLYDQQSQLVGETNLEPLPSGHHLAWYVHEMFDDLAVKAQAREMEGMLVVESDQPLVAVTVRQNDDPAKEFPQEVPILTTFPVMPGASN